MVIAGRNMKKLEKTAEEIRRFGGPVIPLQADLSRMGDIKSLVDRTVKEFGKIDFLSTMPGRSAEPPQKIIRRTIGMRCSTST